MTAPRDHADRPTTEPRTEAGRRMLRRRSYWSGNDDIRAAILAIEAEAASPAALDVRRAIEEISGELSHYDLSDDPGYIKVPTERVRAILRARLTEQEERHD